jgi:hypothetical protein
MKQKIHSCEPSTEKLYELYAALDLNKAENLKKAHALRAQLKRRDAILEDE